MARNIFSVPIFFIVFRETLEAVIIVSVLLGLVEQIVHADSQGGTTPPSIEEGGDQKEKGIVSSQGAGREDESLRKRSLVRKMRFQVQYGVSTERAVPLCS
jgi:high-affinity iron transporter